MPPSTYVPPAPTITSPTARDVAAETAFASTKTPPYPATSRATSSAACGGQTERITSARRDSSATVPASSRPAASARRAVAGSVPPTPTTTSRPAPRRTAPTAAPISPGCSSPIVVSVTLASVSQVYVCFTPSVPLRDGGDRESAHRCSRKGVIRCAPESFFSSRRLLRWSPPQAPSPKTGPARPAASTTRSSANSPRRRRTAPSRSRSRAGTASRSARCSASP